MKKWLLIIVMFVALNLSAQDRMPISEEDYKNTEVPMADRLREDGKIYVLTGIILIILFGTLTYLVVIDKKVSSLEKTIKKES